MVQAIGQVTEVVEADGGAAPPGLLRVAGYGLVLAIVTLLISGVALALFFGGAGAIFGPINDVFTALTLLLFLPAILAVRGLARGRAPAWLSAVSLAAIAGIVFAAAGFFLLVLGVIDLQTSFVTFGVGILPFLAWVVALAVVSLRYGVVSRAVGWWIVAFLVIVGASIVAAPFMPMNLLSLTLAPLLFISLAAWLLLLGRDLLRRATV
jgi:hypothetical protein